MTRQLKLCGPSPIQETDRWVAAVSRSHGEWQMPDAKDKRSLGPKALEMVMRDVLDGMEDLALFKAYQPGAEVVEIIAIEPPNRPESEASAAPCVSQVVPLSRYRHREAG